MDEEKTPDLDSQPIVRSGEGGIIPDEPVVDDRALRGVPEGAQFGAGMGPIGSALFTGGVLGGGVEDPAMPYDEDPQGTSDRKGTDETA